MRFLFFGIIHRPKNSEKNMLKKLSILTKTVKNNHFLQKNLTFFKVGLIIARKGVFIFKGIANKISHVIPHHYSTQKQFFKMKRSVYHGKQYKPNLSVRQLQ